MMVEVEVLSRWLQHDSTCRANDLDPLDHTACSCGLRQYYDPWKRSATISLRGIVDETELDYKEEQAKLRADGWDAYNSDYVDEFPQW